MISETTLFDRIGRASIVSLLGVFLIGMFKAVGSTNGDLLVVDTAGNLLVGGFSLAIEYVRDLWNIQHKGSSRTQVFLQEVKVYSRFLRGSVVGLFAYGLYVVMGSAGLATELSTGASIAISVGIVQANVFVEWFRDRADIQQIQAVRNRKL